MTPRDEQSLLDIVLAGKRIAAFLADAPSAVELERNALLSSAVAWQFHIVGEATKRLGSEFRSSAPHVPWSDMARLRDRVAHGYDAIDWTILCVAHGDLPPAIASVEAILVSRGVDTRLR